MKKLILIATLFPILFLALGAAGAVTYTGSFVGNGSGLTNLPASAVVSPPWLTGVPATYALKTDATNAAQAVVAPYTNQVTGATIVAAGAVTNVSLSTNSSGVTGTATTTSGTTTLTLTNTASGGGVTNLASGSSSVFLASFYKGSSYPGFGTNENMQLAVSADGLNFQNLNWNTNGVLNSVNGVRDPDLLFYQGQWFVVFSDFLSPATETLYIASSSDLFTWTTVTNINTGLTAPNNINVPNWVMDTGGNPHVIFTANDHTVYELHPNTATNLTAPWSSPTNLKDYASANLSPGGNTYVLLVGSTYYMGFDNQAAYYWRTSTNLVTGWSAATSVSFPSDPTGGTGDIDNLNYVNGKIRWYFQQGNNGGGLYQQYYSETANFGTNWTTPTQIYFTNGFPANFVNWTQVRYFAQSNTFPMLAGFRAASPATAAAGSTTTYITNNTVGITAIFQWTNVFNSVTNNFYWAFTNGLLASTTAPSVNTPFANNNVSSNGYNMSNNLVLFHLNDTNSPVADTSSNNYNGIVVGTPLYGQAGKLSTAVTLTNNAYIKVTNTAAYQIAGSFSTSLWLKTTDTSWKPVIGTGADVPTGWMLRQYSTDGKLIMDIRPNSISEGTHIINDGAWHNIVTTFNTNGNVASVYVDGAVDATGSLAAGYTSGTNALCVGYDFQNSRYMGGTFDEVAVFTRVLTTNEIAYIYNTQK